MKNFTLLPSVEEWKQQTFNFFEKKHLQSQHIGISIQKREVVHLIEVCRPEISTMPYTIGRH